MGLSSGVTPTTVLQYDWLSFISNAVPGAIAADLLFPGNSRAALLGAFASAATEPLVFIKGDGNEGLVRTVYHTAPLLGLGAGYGLARIAGLDNVTTAVVSVASMALIFSFARSRHLLAKNNPPTASNEPLYGAVPVYSAMDPSGDPPGVPGSIPPYV